MRSRTIGSATLIGALAFGGYLMLSDFVNLRATRTVEQPQSVDSLPMPQPWGGYGWRALSRLSGDAAMRDPELAASVLLQAAVRYPLDATQWLDLAQNQVRIGPADAPVADLLDKARQSQPMKRSALWRAAQIALQTGNDALAERELREWLELYPSDTGQALFIGRRWIDSPDALLERLLPPGRAFLDEAMKVAMNQRDVPLAEAVWRRLDPKPGLSDPAFLDFADLLLNTGAVDRAVELWASRDPSFTGIGIANGSFSRELGVSSGLNWLSDRTPAAVRIERDSERSWSPPASIRVEFNGKENVRLARPSIRIPVQPGRAYRLSGMWRAETLTTRALPYFEIRSEDNQLRERVPVPVGNFDWEDWDVTFTTPPETRLLTLTLRRDRTNAFDRNIDGTLWIDDLVLEPAPPEDAVRTVGRE